MKLGAKPGRIYTDRDMANSIQAAVNKTEGLGDKDPSTLSVSDVKQFVQRFKGDASFRDAFHEDHFGYSGVPDFVVPKAANRIIEDIPQAMERSATKVFFAKVSALAGRLEFLGR